MDSQPTTPNMTAPAAYYDYDKSFVLGALSELSVSHNIDGTLNEIIAATAKKYDFSSVIISEFVGQGFVKVTNKWASDSYDYVEEYEINNMDNWDGFLSAFDEKGVAIIRDVHNSGMSDRDIQFFDMRGIKSFINFLLYGNDTPIAYITLSKNYPDAYDSTYDLNTLYQLCRVIASFVSSRIKHRTSKSSFDALFLDDLTKLLSYPSFREEVHLKLLNYNPSKVYAIVSSDICNFASLNENFGYDKGDEVLKAFADYVGSAKARDTSLTRVSADHFVAFVIGNSEDEILDRVTRVNEGFSKYLRNLYPMRGLRIIAGVRFVTDPNSNIRIVVDEANHARKKIKNSFTQYIDIFTDEMRNEREQILEVTSSLQDAIASGYIEAFLQPKFSISKSSVIGAEALVRWRNPDGTYRYPDQFIPILENSGMIIDLDMCVYSQVLDTLAKWKKQGKELIPISINISRVDFQHDDLCSRIINMAKSMNIDPKYIEIEVTESALGHKKKHLYDSLEFLRNAGFRIELDDFGTGESSLNMLITAPVDVIKVDKSFIDNYETEQNKKYIKQICSLIDIAEKESIFEGVETLEQTQLLQACGCDNAQGYYYSRPITIGEFEEKYTKEK